MYTNKIFLKLCRSNPTVQQCAVLNIWTPRRKISFMQKCMDCLNSLMRPHGVSGGGANDKLCKVSENCCSGRSAPEEGLPHAEISVTSQRYSANVVIIGAGTAGLSAANHLRENGVENVTVLEALSRPGGRIQSHWFGDSVIELGSEVSKISTGNPIMDQLYKDGFASWTLNKADLSRGLLLRNDGSVIPFPITFEVYQIYKQLIAEARAIEYEQSGQTRVSIMQYIGQRIEQEVRKFPSGFEVDAKRLFLGLASIATARSTHDSALIRQDPFGDFIQLPGSRLRVPLGYFGGINEMYEALPPQSVRLCKTVSKIRWGGVADTFPRAIVICEDGESFPADFVIITIPLGALKALSESLFCPGLPASKLNAILKIPVGHTNKIFLQFSQPFWRWKRDIKKITFDSESMKCKDGWLKGISSIDPMPGSNYVICITVDGPQAQCMEYLTDNDVICDIKSFLKEPLGDNIPDLVKIKRTSWSSNSHFFGAYSYMGPGVSPKDWFDLASPLPEQTDLCDPVLLFAGEATCPVQHGTVKGAQASGLREADRLLHILNVQEQTEQQPLLMRSRN